MKHLGSSTVIILGVLCFIAGVNEVSQSVTYGITGSRSDLNVISIALILGGLVYRSSKVRRLDLKKDTIVRHIAELTGILLIVLPFVPLSDGNIKKLIFEDPIFPAVSIIAVVAWLVSNFLPKGAKGSGIEDNFKKFEPKTHEDGEARSTASSSSLILRSGLYRAEGADFRIYSSGRISLLKSDIKPLGDDATEFKTIGWFLRAFPDIDISLIRRISD